jgi:hypothetical protein
VAALLGVALAIETALAFPNYIAFFNAPSEYVGPINLLSDSNFDWGQDLPALAKWQKDHTDRPLYLAYFGGHDPAFYGITYTSLPGGYFLSRQPAWPDVGKPAYLAISASRLQSMYGDEALRQTYSRLMSRQPLTVLNKTIYIYQYPDGAAGSE